TFFNTMDGYGIRGCSRIQNMILSFSVGFIFLFVRGVSLISLKGRMVTFILSIFLFSLFCLPSFLDHVCTWRVGSYCIVSVGFFFCVGLAEIIWSSKRYLGQQHRSDNPKNTLFSEQF